MIGRTVLHYEITGKLGAGAMGEVYLATDTNLGRHVALKFLPESLSDDAESRTRLLHEAQNASLLNHPNVVTIHAIEHVDDRDFIVMEFIEGQTLKDVLAEGQMSIGRIVEIGCALCEGLSAAHEKGIIHRDIKPDNIFITPRGHVKIADFGIARSQQGAGVTRTGMPVGTVAYMSPEQARGEKGLDARSDVFSLGCVIYEMAVGHRPFEGEHLTAVLYELLSEDPPVPSTLRADLPNGFDALINGVLAKDRDARYQSALEVASALRSVGRDDVRTITPVGKIPGKADERKPEAFSTRMKIGIGLSVVAMLAVIVVGYMTFSKYWPLVNSRDGSGRKMLAVLPFKNLGSADQEGFADGLTEEIISRLSTVAELGVVSRTSVMSFKGSKKTARQIADDLGVEYLIEGSILWAQSELGDRLRVKVSLVQAREDRSLWNETYDTLMSNVFAIQDDIGEQVTGAMQITLVESAKLAAARGSTKNPQALAAFYRASSLFHSGRPAEDIPKAIREYELAIKHDSTYVNAWGRLSRSHAKMVWWGFDTNGDHARRAKTAADRALKLDPMATEAQLANGDYHYRVEVDYPKALRAYEAIAASQTKSVEIYDVYSSIGYVLRRLGRFDDAIAHLQTALTQDPDRGVKNAARKFAERAWEIGNTYMRMRQWTEAARYFEEARGIAPLEDRPYVFLAQLQLYRDGNADSALSILESVPEGMTSGRLTELRTEVSITKRDPGAARRYLAVVNDDSSYYELQRAWIADLEQDEKTRREAYRSAALHLEKYIVDDPALASLHRFLGIAYAGLGRRDDALREGRKALSLIPPEKDAFFVGPSNVEGLARIHTLLGDQDEAIQLLDSVLSLPAGLLTPAYLKIAPEYDALRGNPRFEMLLSKGQPTAQYKPEPIDSRLILAMK